MVIEDLILWARSFGRGFFSVKKRKTPEKSQEKNGSGVLMMDIRVILLVNEKDARGAYVSATEKLGVHVDTVSSFWELRKALIETRYNGVMVDLKTKIKSSKDEKEFAHEILELFPVVQLKVDPDTDKIRTLYFGQAKGGGTLEEFIHTECGSYAARKIRSSYRKKVNFNVILSRNCHFSENSISRTVTIDVSQGGCFIFSSEKWDIQSDAWFTIKELDDVTPIRGEVRWKIPWGNVMRIPGIGLKFEGITKRQLEKITESAKTNYRFW